MKTSGKIILILANLLFWVIALFIGFESEWEFPPFSTEDGSFYPSMLWGHFFNAIVLYVNAFLLFPYRKKWRLPYWFCALVLLLITSTTETLIDYQLIFYLGLEDKFETIFKGENNLFIAESFIQIFSSICFGIFYHLLLYLFTSLKKINKYKKRLKKKN